MAGWDIGQTLPDIPRVYTALAEWIACIVCILELKPRAGRGRTCAVLALSLPVHALFMVLTKGKSGFLWFLFMAVAVLFMYLLIYVCSDITALDAAYSCIRAFVMAEFAASLEWQIHCYCYYDIGFDRAWLAAVILAVIYGIVYAVLLRLGRNREARGHEMDITKREVLLAAVIGISVFLCSNLGFVYSNTPFGGRYAADIFNVRTLVDLGGLAVFYAYHIQRLYMRSQHELEHMEMILHSQYAQYQQSQETLDLIHYKYHDLKHHILALRAEEDAQKRGEYLDRMEEEIKSYETQQHTGNSVLDTLLTSKSICCMKNGISLTIVADGALLDFMDVMDICSIFGNALDNAIEYEMKLADREKRMIHVSVFSQKNFLIIRVENYCEGVLEFKKELPVTTKADREQHGYGLKSVRHTVRKYGGEVDISLKDSWFGLKILIPI
ncbi:MAG: GHKL domain-containing protein [Eubacterium sp.]|jgi:hypothetical protein|nr:GHKL domain-containing protein [Eubacterium sp.]